MTSASPAPAPGEAESVALSLVNTELRPHDRSLDLLPDAQAVRTWLFDRGLGVPAREVTQDRVGELHALRSAIRELLGGRIRGIPAASIALGTVNSAAASASYVPQLAWDTDLPRLEPLLVPGVTPWDAALARIAQDAVHTVLGRRGLRLRACEAHGCHRLFIQDHGRRRWCSRGCGDRVRVARHYRRHHPVLSDSASDFRKECPPE